MKQFTQNSPPTLAGSPGFFRHAGWLSKVATILLLLMSFLPKESLATHFRYGDITWNWVNGKTVTFHVTQSWRRSYFPGPPNVGTVISATNLDFGDATAQVPINITVTTVNTTEDWVYGEATITHTYANNGTYTALFANCCRLSSLLNNHDQNFQVETIVNIGSGISSPVSSMPPLIALQTGLAPAKFQLIASDPNGRVLSYRLATPTEMGGTALVQPTGISINPTTGMVSFPTTGLAIGNIYNASFVVSDGLASIWVDVILQIVAQSTAPSFNYSITPANGFTYNVQPGQNVNFSVNAYDMLSTDPVTLQALGLPSGVVLTPLLPQTGNPVQTNFSWTPTLAQLGSRLVNFVATDINGVQTSTSVTITVSLNPVFDVPPTPANNSTICIQRGEAFSYTVQAHAPDPTVTLQISSVTDGISGVTHTPAIPTPAGNTSSTVFSGIASGFGTKVFSATATDNLGHSTSTTWSLLVDVPPAFTSTPSTTTITQNQPFSYAITIADPDIILGDTVEIDGVIIPSWMTFTQTGPTTGLLTGNPGTANVGTFHVQLNTSDIYEHCYGPVTQSFDIVVNPCAFTESISASPSATNNCPGTPVVLTAIAADSYSWNTGETTQSITVTSGASAVHSVNAISGFCSSMASITVSGVDTTAPTAICQNITIQLDGYGNANITAAQINNGSSDACGIASMIVSPTAFTCANVGPNAVTLTVTDVNGNVSTCTSTVTVQDLTPPAIHSFNIGLTLDQTGNVTITPAQIDNGSTDACGIASMSVFPNTFTCANLGSNTSTFTVTDVNGNISTASIDVEIYDQYPPTPVCHNITVQLDATGNASITAAQIDNGSFDACGIKSMSVFPNTFSCSNVGQNNVTLTVTDNSGNFAQCDAVVTVQDLTPPAAICQNITVQLDATGNASILAAQVNNGSSDVCGIASMSVSPNAFTCANVGTNPVTLTVTDVNGNVSTCASTVTVQDLTAPTAVCQNITVQLDATGNASITAAQINNGSSDVCGIASMTVSPNAFTCANVGANPVTFTATDVNGNVSTCTSMVTVQDLIAPTAVCQNITVNLDATGNAAITAAQVNNGSSDVCGIKSMTVSPNSFTCANVGSNAVTLTVTDVNGNVSTCTSTVTVRDLTPPSAICQNTTIKLDATGNAGITAAQVNNGSSDACGIASMTVSPNAFTCANVGPNTVTLTVTDVNGNVSTCTSTVTVQDLTAPTAACQNITVNLDATGNAAITAAQVNNGSSDICGIKSMAVSPNTFTCANVGPNSVTFTVTDVNGNTSVCTSTVTVKDVTAPTAVCQNIAVNLDATGNAVITAAQVNNGSSDVCGIKSMTVSPNTFTCANAGPNTVTLTVTDVNGNASTCTSTVTVTDNIAPNAICHNATISLDATGHATLLASQINNGSTDNCAIVAMSVSPNSFTCANVGVNAVTLTVTDAHGNSSKCTATVTVVDNTPPVAICHNATIYLDATGHAVLTAAQINNGSTDNCGIASVTVAPSTFTCANVGTNAVTLTVTDVHGNVSTCTASAIVVDNTPPTVSCKNVTVTLVNGAASITAAQVTNSSADNCGIASLKVSPAAFSCSNIGANTVTLTATDTHGNTATCQATVTVVGTAPSCKVTASHPCSDNAFTGGNPTTIYLGYGPQNVVLNAIATGGTTFTYSWSGTGLSCTTCASPVFKPTAAGMYTFTVKSTNNYGCSTTCSITICVLDIRVPKTTNVVYLCHVPNGNPKNPQTLAISINAVEDHLENHPSDHLGQCNQVCGSTKEEESLATVIAEMGDLSIIAYPNPFAEAFHVQIESATDEDITIRLYSITGQLMETLDHVTADKNITLGHNVPNGMYFLEVQQGQSKKVVKVQKAE